MGQWPENDRGLFAQGTILDKQYEITGYIGQGAYGAVYEGRQSSIGRRVAIKVMKSRLDANARARFLQEAQAAAIIDHPNVVTIHDFGVHDNAHPYIVMEHLEGHDLDEELKANGALEMGRALRLFVGCLDALGEVHAKGIVHKDLKPSNLFIKHPGTRREALMILDFGVARVTDGSGDELSKPSDARRTQTGKVLGTPRYMAPEYIRSQIATPALDVYQMGLIIAEAISGKPLINASSGISAMMAHSEGSLEIPQMVQDDEVLGPILLKAMAKEHTERHPDAWALMKDLESVQRHQPASAPDSAASPTPTARPNTPSLDASQPAEPRPAPQKRSGRWRWAVGALVLLAALGGVAAVGLVGAAALGLHVWNQDASLMGEPPTKELSKRGKRAPVKKRPAAGRKGTIKLSKLTPANIRARLKTTQWTVWREDRPEAIDGFVIVITRPDHVGGSIMHHKCASADEARTTRDALSVTDGTVSVQDGRLVVTISVLDDDQGGAEQLADVILAP